MLEHTMCLNCLCRLFMSSSSSTLTTPAFLATSLPAKAVYRISPTSPTDRAVVHPISLPDWVRDDSVLASTHGRCRRARRFMPFLASVVVHLRQGFGIVQRLANADPSNVAWQRDPALTYIRLGDLHKRQGNGPDRAGAR